MDLQAGELVMLKSGGPIMTVATVQGDEVSCFWIDKNKTYREAFPAVVLKKYQRPQARAIRF